jgi:cytochrome c
VVAVIALVGVHRVSEWMNQGSDAPGDVVLEVPNSQTNNHILGVALAPDGRFATGTRGGTVTLRTAMGEPLLTWQAHAGAVMALSILPDSSTVVSVERDGVVRAWSLSAGAPLLRAEVRTSGPVFSAVVSSDGQLLAIGSLGRITVWRLMSDCLKPVVEFTPAPYAINALAFSADGRTLAAGNGGDGCAWVWRLEAPAEPQQIDLSPEFQIRGLRFTGDGKGLVAVDTDGNVILANAGASARAVGRLPGRCVQQATFSPDGQRVIIGYVDGTARLTAIPARAAVR